MKRITDKQMAQRLLNRLWLQPAPQNIWDEEVGTVVNLIWRVRRDEWAKMEGRA